MFNRIQKAIRHPRLAIRHIGFVSHRAFHLHIARHTTKCRAWLFDTINGVKTRTIVEHERLDCNDSPYLDNATYYAACPMSTLRMTIGYVVKTYNDASYFVDVGCGEGRACFFAARFFDKILGIDFSPALIEAANTNLRNFSGDGHKIEFSLKDAATFRLPEARCVVFIFNPFDEVVLGRFLQMNYQHFSRFDSIIIYVSDVCSELLLRKGFLRSYKFTRGPKAVSIYTAGPQIAAPESVKENSGAILCD
jgi:SAM-dependent methyltransferase